MIGTWVIPAMYEIGVRRDSPGMDVGRPGPCHTGPVNRAAIADRLRAGAARLRRASSPPPRLSYWAWTADAIIALVVAAGVVIAAEVAGGGPVVHVSRMTAGIGQPAMPLPPAVPGVVIGVGADVGAPNSAKLTALAILIAVPLVVRRRYPLAAFWVVTSVTLLFHVGPGVQGALAFTFAACLITAYGAAMYSPYRPLAVACVVVGAGLIAVYHDRNVPDIGPAYVPFLALLPIGLAANTIHTWKQRVRVLEAEREAATRRAVERERSRIARELHDVVTHNVSVMVIQAGAARKVIDAAPDQARQALLAVEAGGRAAMAELRHVMGLLAMAGGGSAPAELAPQPGLDQVAALAGRIRDTGVPVELTVNGTPVPLPAGVDLTAYRVVQEALTNTVKHAAGAHVAITIGYGPDAVRIAVADTGGTASASVGSGDGRGLIGLRERLAVYGGTLHAGKRLTGGYLVRAVIPVEGQ